LRSALMQAEECESAMRKLGPVIPVKYSGWKGLGNSGSSSYASAYVVSTPSYAEPSHPESTTYSEPAYASGGLSPPSGPGLSPPGGLAPPPSGPQARGLYPFIASSPQELSFQPGDLLRILNQDGAWWQAELNGAVGLIPSNYVELC